MRILVVISKYLPEYTGASYRLHKLYKSLMLGNNASVMCGGIEQKKALTYNYEGMNIERLRDRSSGIINRWLRVPLFYMDFYAALQALKKRNFDLLHIAGTSAQTCAALYYAARNDIPTVLELVTKEAHPAQPLPVLGKFMKPALPRRTIIVAISEPLARRCRQYGYSDICWMRPNPVDENRFFPAGEQKRDLRQKLLPFSDYDIVMTMIAKFMPQKNQIFLLDVLKELPEQFKLALAGPTVTEGPLAIRDQNYIKRLEDRIIELKLQKRVFLHKGFIDAPELWMKASDIYLLPNKDEGLGTPLLEAQACALPIVANKEETAFHQWVEHGKTGFLVELEPASWATAIEKCSSLSHADLGSKAREIIAQYGFDKTLQTYRNIFSQLAYSPDSLPIKAMLLRNHA